MATKNVQQFFFNPSLLLRLGDPRSGMGKKSGSGINIPDPQHCHFCLMIKGSATVLLTNGSGSGRPKNFRVQRCCTDPGSESVPYKNVPDPQYWFLAQVLLIKALDKVIAFPSRGKGEGKVSAGRLPAVRAKILRRAVRQPGQRQC